MLKIAVKHNLRCILRYLKAPKQPHFRIKYVYRTRNTYFKQKKLLGQNHGIRAETIKLFS